MSQNSELRRLREERGLTQRQLAEIIGVEQSMISHHENKRRMLGMDKLFTLHERLGFPLVDLLKDYEGDPRLAEEICRGAIVVIASHPDLSDRDRAMAVRNLENVLDMLIALREGKND